MTITTRQIVIEYDDVRQTYKFSSENAVEDFMAMKSDISAMIELLNTDNTADFLPQFGSGSPESVVTANLNGTYYDTDGVNAVQYINETAGNNTGWQEVQ